MRLSGLDHLVLTVADLATTLEFYQNVLGMTAERFMPADEEERWALKFGTQKINLHQVGRAFEPKAKVATAGSADLCFLSDIALEEWAVHLADYGVEVIEGPVKRTGAQGAIMSLYLRDPDGNLLEISIQL